ncbi:MAG: Arm DNA-binding domain-containing protein [Desulfovibrionaceae bacterium]|nr:Arm DNA-binding domain-containing protein [Desulfovibrionaceae bacterium]
MRSSEKSKKFFDGEGLFLQLTPAGGKWWRFRYWFQGKEKLLSLGTYPGISLKMARQRRDAARELIAQGLDPSKQRQAAKDEAAALAKEEALTFKTVAAEWLEVRKDTYAASNIKKKDWLIGLLCAHLGNTPIAKIAPADILAAIRPVEAP